jgi:hypothetical protein
MRLRGWCARGDVERDDRANALKRTDGSRGASLMRDDEAGSAYARSSEGLQPVAQNAVIGFLSDARRRNRMRAGDMRNG